MELDLIPYFTSPALAAEVVLVLAPHPDDEVFGCGGAIASHVRARTCVNVIVLTDGALFGDTSSRQRESLAAAKVLGYGVPEFWHLPDGGLQTSDELVQRIAQKIMKGRVDLVYAPSPWEVHPDHRHASFLAMESVRQSNRPVQLAFYEVGTPLRPNYLLDITEHLATKDAAMRCFASQLAQQDYLRHIRALNQYRTYTLPRDVLAAEAYCVMAPGDLEQAWQTGFFRQGLLGSPLPARALPCDQPLVSILIRSTGRACLAEALDSVSLQTYSPIEVIVVAASVNHPPLPSRFGGVSVTLLHAETPLPRSKAANKALQAATGAYLLFLDDDDWLMPGHIARLVHAVSVQPHALAVYTGIALVDENGHPLGQVFDLPFDAVRQLAGNLTPIHAVLFSAKAVEVGCRFDETIDLYEDWDFWLQLARLGPMVHVPGVSGAYRIHASSGVHTDSGPKGAAAETIYKKWRSEWTPVELGQMMQRVWSYQDMERTLSENQLVLAESRQQLVSMEAHFANKERQTDEAARYLSSKLRELAELSECLAKERQDRLELLQSRSWRLTRPLRWSTDLLRKIARPQAHERLRHRVALRSIKMELPLPNIIQKAYAFWRKYGARAAVARVRAELARPKGPPQTTFALPARGTRTANQIIHARFEALTPLPVFEVPVSQHRRVSIVTDSIGRGSLFGGVGTALILATLLANRLGANLRIITRTEAPQPANVDHLLLVYGIELAGEMQFKFAPPNEKKQGIDFTQDELFLTTSWWTTAATLSSIAPQSIIYLLQEDERMFYPYGDDRIHCENILCRTDIRFLINTKLLFNHLLSNGLPHIKEKGMWFEPAFPAKVFHPRKLAGNQKRKFVFYARPNNLRNLFYLGLDVINNSIAKEILNTEKWEIIFVGKDIPDFIFDNGTTPIKYENMNWSDYAALAGTADLALCLMYTPHPSYPPLDLVASGAVVVTNQFGNKKELDIYSKNLICAELTRDALTAAIREGVSLALDGTSRERNFTCNTLYRDWKKSFSEIIENIAESN